MLLSPTAVETDWIFGVYQKKLKINKMSQASCEFFSAGAATGLCRCSKLLYKFFL